MANIWKPRYVRPRAGSQIDWSHPFSQSLTMDTEMWEGSGLLYDLVGLRFSTTNSNASWGGGSLGSGRVYAAGYDTWGNIQDTTVGNMSIMVIHQYSAVPTAVQTIVSKYLGTGGGFQIGSNSTTPFAARFVTNFSTFNATAVSGNSPTVGINVLIGTWAGGSVKTATLYENGAQVATNTNASMGSITNSAFLTFGARNNTTTSSFTNLYSGTIYTVRMWNKVLPAELCAWLSNDPWAHILQPSNRKYFILPGGGTPVSSSDTGTGSDSQTLLASISGSETGTGTEASTLLAGILSSDTATGTDASSLVVSISSSDSGTGTEGSTLVQGGVTSNNGSDTASGSDGQSVAAILSNAETGAGTDGSTLLAALTSSDTATATEGQTVTIVSTVVSNGTGTNVLLPAQVLDTLGSRSQVLDVLGTRTQVLDALGTQTQVRVYTQVSPAEKALVNNLSAFWELGESSGSRLDSSGNNITLTANNAPGVVTSGSFGQVLNLVGSSSQYLSRPDEAAVRANNTGDFTIAFWVNMQAVGSTQMLVTKCSLLTTGQLEFCCQTNTSNRILWRASDGITAAPSVTTAVMTLGQWYFVRCWWDSSDGYLYAQLNQQTVVQASGGTLTKIQNLTNEFRIGARAQASAAYATCYMSGVGMWKRKLSQEEHNYFYNQGVKRFYPWYC